MKKISLLLAVYFFLLTAVLAETIPQVDDVTVIGGGARPLGMGRAFTAVADDVDASLINPAGLAALKGPEAMAMFTNLLGEVYYAEYCGAVPASFGSLGVAYVTTGTNNIPTTPPSDYYDSLFLVSYSTPLNRFFGYSRNIFVGCSLKVFNSGFTGGVNDFASGFSADLGIKYIVNQYLSIGFNRQNILPVSLGGFVRHNTGIIEALAGLNKFGLAVRPIPWAGKVLLAADIDLPAATGRPPTMHFGAEWKIMRQVMVRAGFDQSVDATTQTKTSWNPSAGLSFSVGSMRIDYAYHPYYNDAALATSYLSLTYVGEPWLALKGGPARVPETSTRERDFQ